MSEEQAVLVRRVYVSFVEAFEEVRWDPEEIVEVDESRTPSAPAAATS